MPRATCFLSDSHFTATNLQTAHHGSDLWAGSGLAGPEAILRLPPAALSTSKGETHQPILLVCLMPLVQLQAGMTA